MQGRYNPPKPTSRVQGGLYSVSHVMAVIAAVVLGIMMLLTTSDVVGRYFFNYPIKGTYELIGLMLICAATWGLAYCQIYRGHIRITVLFDRFSPRLQAGLDTLAYLMGLGAFSLICWRMLAMAKEYILLGDTGTTETLGIPYFPFMLMLAIGVGMLCLILVMDLFQSFRKAKQGILVSISVIIGLGLFYWLLSHTIVLDRAAIGFLGIAVLIFLLFLGVHIGFALIMVGFVGFALVGGIDAALSNIAIVSFDKINRFHFAVIPLFLLMSSFVSEGKIAREAYQMVRTWIGHVRGGLSMATVGACGLFAACSGSSLAGAVTMGKVAYPEMMRFNYSSKLAVGCIAAGGTLGILIPPSIGFIIIGILTELSIGKLFMAGIIPGLLEIVFYFGTIYILCRLNPQLGPTGARTNIKQKIGSLKLTWPVVLLFLMIVGGIYGGVFTPTEAGGIGAFGALVIGLMRKRLSRSGFKESLIEASKMAALMIILLVGAFMFNAFLAITRIPFVASEFIVGLGLSKYIVLFVILIFYIVLGMFFDIYAILILTIPIIFPTIEALGFDPIWYGVIMVRVVEIGLITPPFGINLFGLAGTVDIPVGTLYRGIIPFFLADLLHVILLIAVPSLCTFIPRMMM
ncbi:MAG: TRAP transporter large permease subunit [Deltaproteobacteria bacterium]|nr:TRAP transporter large permease subunit [Deltaproteobacteria bacterium]